jgi:hypothetical protein
MNPRPAHLFMICSNIKLTGPAESIAIDAVAIHEWNQRDPTMNVQRKLEIPADANFTRGIPEERRWMAARPAAPGSDQRVGEPISGSLVNLDFNAIESQG